MIETGIPASSAVTRGRGSGSPSAASISSRASPMSPKACVALVQTQGSLSASIASKVSTARRLLDPPQAFSGPRTHLGVLVPGSLKQMGHGDLTHAPKRLRRDAGGRVAIAPQGH